MGLDFSKSELLARHPLFILSECYLMHICNWQNFLLLTKNGLERCSNILHKRHIKSIFFQKEICIPLTAKKIEAGRALLTEI